MLGKVSLNAEHCCQLPALILVAVAPPLHDHLPGVDRRRVPEVGTPGPEADHPDAPPVSEADRGRILLPRQEHDT